MAKNIDPKLKKIGDYLKLDESAIFSIPEYQRAYSWGITQCDKLWQDITAFIESDGSDPYFFGTIIVNCLENDKVLSLIDGQQRTTTFLLLLKALLVRLIKAVDETSKDGDSESLNDGLKAKRNSIMKILYKADDEDISDILKDFGKVKDIAILENRSINELHKDETKRIFEAVDYYAAESTVTRIPYKQKDNKFTAYFRNFKFFYEQLQQMTPSEVNVFAKNLLEKCEIIEIRSWNVEQAITMFNSLNSDGMPLLDADIISAQLYAKSGNDKEQFNKQWKEILNNVNTLDTCGIANIDAILMQFMYINRARRKEYITDKGSINVTTPGLRRYYTEINRELLDDPLLLCDELIKLTEIWLKIKDYAVVKLLLKFNENVKLYLAGYLSRFTLDEILEETVARICECLLKLFSVLELVDTGYSSSKFKTFLFGENIKFVDRSVDIEEIERDFIEHISRTWTSDDIKKEVSEYDKNVLVFLNEYLYATNKGLKFAFTEKYDIEHIMPSSGKNLPQIRLDAGISDHNEFSDLVNKLGNKLLLEEDINRSIGNEWFRTKIQTSVANKSGYENSKYAIPTALVEAYKDTLKPYWLKEDIISATEKIVKRVSRYIFNATEK
jgi:Uncharacterized conserved protein